MGNSCSCDNRADDLTNQQLNSENTPRHNTKPEKLPSISQAVKCSFKKLGNELHDSGINNIHNNNHSRLHSINNIASGYKNNSGN